ncbi:MAG TPA: DUF4367 domain-containing protein [Candidatus Fimisoma avicola]|uniref:DUF4367 domain-containing protein n=1 Tax=Candidatus Fimisoma avicola TaxID=2840826 RepID=A0A9D1L8D0_9FIRM|nr:DUF4367 domain-containing protein [Candidatus Fimisoma avicola]
MRDKKDIGKNIGSDEILFTDEELRKIGELAGKLLEKETAAYEERIRNDPQLQNLAPDEKILEMLRAADREREKSKRRAMWRSIGRIAAIFLVCITVAGGIGMGTSEAFRTRVFEFFSSDEESYAGFRSNTEEDMLAGWSDYWYPEYMPDGFIMTYAEDDGWEKFMLFESAENDSAIRIFITYADNYVIQHDTEHNTIEEVRIGIYTGVLAISDEDDTSTLFWQTEDSLINIDGENFSDKEEILKIAEGMKYTK